MYLFKMFCFYWYECNVLSISKTTINKLRELTYRPNMFKIQNLKSM